MLYRKQHKQEKVFITERVNGSGDESLIYGSWKPVLRSPRVGRSGVVPGQRESALAKLSRGPKHEISQHPDPRILFAL